MAHTIAVERVDHELILIFNANAGDLTANILMDVPDKFPCYTHIALRVASITSTVAALKENDIAITQGPVSFGESGQVSVFVRDPDRNVIELRGRDQGVWSKVSPVTFRKAATSTDGDAGQLPVRRGALRD
jgi:hypothetical protein